MEKQIAALATDEQPAIDIFKTIVYKIGDNRRLF